MQGLIMFKFDENYKTHEILSIPDSIHQSLGLNFTEIEVKIKEQIKPQKRPIYQRIFTYIHEQKIPLVWLFTGNDPSECIGKHNWILLLILDKTEDFIEDDIWESILEQWASELLPMYGYLSQNSEIQTFNGEKMINEAILSFQEIVSEKYYELAQKLDSKSAPSSPASLSQHNENYISVESSSLSSETNESLTQSKSPEIIQKEKNLKEVSKNVLIHQIERLSAKLEKANQQGLQLLKKLEILKDRHSKKMHTLENFNQFLQNQKREADQNHQQCRSEIETLESKLDKNYQKIQNLKRKNKKLHTDLLEQKKQNKILEKDIINYKKILGLDEL
jgi:hypothetical protein